MKKYIAYSIMHSIVQPGMLDVMLTRDGHFAGSVRMPLDFENDLMNVNLTLHETKDGAHVAYCFGTHMYLEQVPLNEKMAGQLLGRFAGLRDFSLDKFRFYMALRRSLGNSGVQPHISANKNLMCLAQMQMKKRTK